MRDKEYEPLLNWIIETDPEQEETERVFQRNGYWYYANNETGEFIHLGPTVTEPSNHDWKTVTRRTIETVDYPKVVKRKCTPDNIMDVHCQRNYRHLADYCEGHVVEVLKPEFTTIEVSEFFDWSWQLVDSMGSWDGRDISLVFPDRWICDTCFLEKHKWHNFTVIDGKKVPLKVCRDCQ